MKAAFRKALACALLAGCSGGSGSGGPDGGPRTGPIPLDDFADAVVNAFCDRAVACSVFPDLTTCLASGDVLAGKPVDAAGLVRSGVAQYDPVAAAACLDALPRDCWEQNDWVFEELQFLGSAICRKVFKGTLTGTSLCCSGIECVSELCNGIGICEPQPLVPVGGHCDSNASLYCEFGLLCSPSPAGTCVAPLPTGANCADQPYQQCEPFSYCSSAAIGSPTPGFCTAVPDEGEPCDSNGLNACRRVDDYCDPSTELCTRRLPPGAPCSVQTSPCVPYAGCGNEGCTSRPGLGEACTVATGCIRGLPCVNNVCSPASPPVSICQP